MFVELKKHMEIIVLAISGNGNFILFCSTFHSKD